MNSIGDQSIWEVESTAIFFKSLVALIQISPFDLLTKEICPNLWISTSSSFQWQGILSITANDHLSVTFSSIVFYLSSIFFLLATNEDHFWNHICSIPDFKKYLSISFMDLPFSLLPLSAMWSLPIRKYLCEISFAFHIYICSALQLDWEHREYIDIKYCGRSS